MSTTEENTDRLGLEYLHIIQDQGQDDATVCKASCKNDPRCNSWTYVDPGVQNATYGLCWLKSAKNIGTTCSFCTSGYKLTPTKSEMSLSETDRDRFGHEFFQTQFMNGETESDCEALCQKNGLCGSWTFVEAGLQGPYPRCWLKSAGNESTETCDMCTAGKKVPNLIATPPVANTLRIGHPYNTINNSSENACLLACQNDNKCMSWNLNTNNQCTLNITVNESQISQGDSSGYKVEKRILNTRLAAGENHTCFVQKDNTIKCWGDNDAGQLGNNTTTDSTIPVSVNNLNNAYQVAASKNHSCAVLRDGTVSCWGKNANKQLGNGTSTDSLTPVAVNTVSNAIQVATADKFSCALLGSAEVTIDNITTTETGVINCWGAFPIPNNRNSWPSADPSNMAYAELVNVKKIAIGSALSNGHICALKQSGTVTCLGKTAAAGPTDPINFRNNIATVSGLTNAIDIATSDLVSCAIEAGQSSQSNTVNCWGYIDSSNVLTSPIVMAGLDGAVRLSVSGNNQNSNRVCATLYDGTIKCSAYGKGDYSVAGASNDVDVANTLNGACALQSFNDVQCWDELPVSTDPTAPKTTSPVKVIF
ncbi:PAN domain-containing protein [Pseudoalteromonas aurantia]|nr:PAN domain-containing protein [Pseudoalteromonas aurantia]